MPEAGVRHASDPVQSAVAFTYDNRNRLVRERRAVQTQPETVTYDFSYRYDQNGNRVLKRADEANYVAYAYDVDENPLSTASRANRLLEYTVVADSQEVERVHYVYDGFGHVGRIVRHDVLTDQCFATNLYYTTGGRLWLALDQTWDVNTNGPENCQNVRCREFRYDSGRARYLVRGRRVDVAPTSPEWLAPINDAVWTDYVGDWPYAERSIDRDSGAAADRASFLPGVAQRDESPQPPAVQPLYFHGDQIGSTRVLTDGDGNVAARVVYTAFGEPVFSEPGAPATGATRYLYAGAWGYENFNDAAFPFLHVGERWYDPASGRFLQRDPIGIDGGLNVYEYVGNTPTEHVDPDGQNYVAPGSFLPKPDWAARAFLEATGGVGYVPFMDPGPAQTAVLTCTNVASFAAPVGAGARAVTLTPKALNAARAGWCGKYLVRIRRFIRYDRVPHHRKGAGHWHLPWDR